MACLRTDVAIEFISGREASNSTKSFRSVRVSTDSVGWQSYCKVSSEIKDRIRHSGDYMHVLYTYNVPLVVRLADGSLIFPVANTPYEKLTLHTKYSQTSSIHQHATLVALDKAGVCS